MLLKSLHLENILSFGPDGVDLEMRPLNVLIGPNGSGKSNLIEIIGLLAAAPRDIQEPFRRPGGMLEWAWKGARIGAPTIEADVGGAKQSIRYTLQLGVESGTPIERVWRPNAQPPRILTVGPETGGRVVRLGRRRLPSASLKGGQSVLSRPEIAGRFAPLLILSNWLERVAIYREWTFGPRSAIRRPQPTDTRGDFLSADGSNLGMVLSALGRNPAVKERIVTALQRLYDGITGYEVVVQGGTVQVFLHEGRRDISTTRLSDGTLRYLCLLAILCHPEPPLFSLEEPEPPPLVCIEEPELGLHPDILPGLADLLRDASERMQLVVTTHSDILVDALTDTPECVVICEKDERGTHLRRLDKEQLKPWLEKYRLGLGELWTSGELGGKRW